MCEFFYTFVMELYLHKIKYMTYIRFSNVKALIFTVVMFFITIPSMGQQFRWDVGLDYFFDNTEYGKSTFVNSQTMNGVRFQPLVGLTWDEKHTIYGGIHLLKIPGTKTVLDKTELTLFYEYQTPNVIFKAGAFPRRDALSDYNTFFFKDSVQNFNPLMRGVFWQIGKRDTYLNIWMDWTSYASATSREKFYFGFSGKVTKGLFFADFQSYVHHNANTLPPILGEGVRENWLLQSTLGLHYAHKNDFEAILAAGVLAGYERDRRFEEAFYKPVGFVGRLDAEYQGIGTKNTLYLGNSHLRMYDKFGDDLYAGTQFLRGKAYWQSEYYVRLIESNRVKAKFNINLHFSESNIYFQQMLTVSARIGNVQHPQNNIKTMSWKKIFE